MADIISHIAMLFQYGVSGSLAARERMTRTHENARRKAGHHQKDRVIGSDR
jgi:hypothetical protein